MNKYIPFLKIKVNEIGALKELDRTLQQKLTPFFDLPRDQKKMTENKLVSKAKSAKTSISNNLKNIPSFYLDNYDIDSSIKVNGKSNYKYILELFQGMPLIPVVGIDRGMDHINAVVEAKKTNILKSDLLALRLTPDDFENFELSVDDIDEMLTEVIEKFEKIDLIFDCRVCKDEDKHILAANIINFIDSFIIDYSVNKIIVTGSSLPASITEIVSTNKVVEHDRTELEIFRNVATKYNESFDISLGDYSVVSPNYSDVSIGPELLRTVTAAKVLYSYKDKHYIMRGRGLKQYGNGQYNLFCNQLISESFYRGEKYSWGDNFIKEKSLNKGKQVTQSNILKPTINAHITYMMLDYIC